MAYKKKTLRIMSPTARKVARLIGEQESIAKRLKNLIPELQSLEMDSKALSTAKQGLQVTDSDLWGLRDALYHCQQTGYDKDNKEWTQAMLDHINEMREQLNPIPAD